MVSGRYTDKDAIRAAKQTAAAMQQLHDSIHSVAAATGQLIAIMDEMDDEPMQDSKRYGELSSLIDILSTAYDQLADYLNP